MNNTEYKEYAKIQRKNRWLQIWYGNKIFSMPRIYKLKNNAYTKMFSAGKGLIVGYDVFLYRTHRLRGKITIGDNVHLSDHVTIDYSGEVIIGNKVYLSNGVKVYSHVHNCYEMVHNDSNTPKSGTTVIANNAWIGSNAIILSGVTIGEYAVVGAGSIVTHDVPPNTVYAGNPARYIRDNKPNNRETL